MMTIFLVDAPENTLLRHYTGTMANTEVEEWLNEKNIRAWSIFTEDDGAVKFIFIDEIQAMLFRLRWS